MRIKQFHQQKQARYLLDTLPAFIQN
jgi:hypothetical protein